MTKFQLSRISKSDDWKTPKWLYNHLNSRFNFNDDPCPIGGNGGLDREWGTRTFFNPPYSNPKPWVEKAILESRKGKHIVMLLRVDVSTRWYKLLMKENVHIAYFNERIFKGSNFCSMLVFIHPEVL